MPDLRRPVEIGIDVRTVAPGAVGAAEVLQVRIDGVPLDEQQKPGGGLDTPGHAYGLAPLGLRQDGARMAERREELGLLSLDDVDVDNFENHRAFPPGRSA